MLLSAHQPAYLPWLGYFDKIARSDLFVFLDNVQYEKNSFINRNRIKTAQGPAWLTIPVLTKGHTSSTLAETRIDNRQRWREKHLKAIHQSYCRAPRFDECYPKLERLFATEHDGLADLCFAQLLFWLAEAGIERPLVRGSSLDMQGRKSDLILWLCRQQGATAYLSGAMGRDYLDEKSFRDAGINIMYQDFASPRYEQLHGDFEPALSIVDCWMNGGTFEILKATTHAN